MRCEQCKWWDTFDREEKGYEGWRTCKLPEQPPGVALCDVSDNCPGDGYAGLYTAPNFGCVKFEATQKQRSRREELLSHITYLWDIGHFTRDDYQELSQIVHGHFEFADKGTA